MAAIIDGPGEYRQQNGKRAEILGWLAFYERVWVGHTASGLLESWNDNGRQIAPDCGSQTAEDFPGNIVAKWNDPGPGYRLLGSLDRMIAGDEYTIDGGKTWVLPPQDGMWCFPSNMTAVRRKLHPDAEKPKVGSSLIDAKWLMAAGFAKCDSMLGDDVFSRLVPGHCNRKTTLLLRREGGDEWLPTLVQEPDPADCQWHYDTVRLAPVTTRAEVSKLVAGLG